MDAAGLAVVLCLVFVVYVLLLIRLGQLREGFALIWLLTGAGMAALASRRRWIDAIGHALGVQYPPAFFLLLGLLFTLLIVLNLTVYASRHHDRTVRLAQEVAFLRGRLEEVETRLDLRGGPGQRPAAGGGPGPVETSPRAERRV